MPSPADLDKLKSRIEALRADLLELEYTLIPHGLHVFGEPPNGGERADPLLRLLTSALLPRANR